MLKPTERFSSRVSDYVLYRPSYPRGIVDLLVRECGLNPEWRVADLGAGPGNLARLFLENGNPVVGVEPNREMREAGDELLAGFAGYRSLDGTAETTGLPDASVDLVTAGQAFHWFDQGPTRREMARILKPGGWLALIWNIRKSGTRFQDRYDAILRTIPEYHTLKEDRASAPALREFFSPGLMREARFDHEQVLDRDGFLGRVLSSSYVPQSGPEHDRVVGLLTGLFDEEQVDGTIRFEYQTEVYYGRL